MDWEEFEAVFLPLLREKADILRATPSFNEQHIVDGTALDTFLIATDPKFADAWRQEADSREDSHA